MSRTPNQERPCVCSAKLILEMPCVCSGSSCSMVARHQWASKMYGGRSSVSPLLPSGADPKTNTGHLGTNTATCLTYPGGGREGG